MTPTAAQRAPPLRQVLVTGVGALGVTPERLRWATLFRRVPTFHAIARI